MEKKVCIIGAGLSGLASTKHCIDAGLTPTCFEAGHDVGGLWNFGNSLSVPYCTVTNTSKEETCFSDFPMPDDFPNFMHADKLFEYLKEYAKKNKLLNYIKFGCEVVNLECCASHGNCVCASCVKYLGKYWKVTVRNGDIETEEYFDYVVVASGFNSEPYIPEEVSKSLNGFTGKLIHSSQYRTWKPFENKRIVICGLGNSGGDISCELSRHASQVYLATKHGSFILGRLKSAGYPWDTKLITRASNMIPILLKKILIPFVCNSAFNHTNFGLEPVKEGSPFYLVPMINDEIPTRISTGTLVMKPNIERTSGKSVVFADGSCIDDIDAIIICTGYKRKFVFLKDEDMLGIPSSGKNLGLYKFIFPAMHVGRIAFVGATGVSGSVTPIFEMQSRYAVEVFRGALKLPTTAEMNDAVAKQLQYYDRVKKVVRETMRVNFIQYQDELASDIGARPCIWKLLLTDPLLAVRLVFGPACPYQYRLTGPGAWDGARQAILTADERIWYPFRQKKKHGKSKAFFSGAIFCSLLVIFVAVFISYCWIS